MITAKLQDFAQKQDALELLEETKSALIGSTVSETVSTSVTSGSTLRVTVDINLQKSAHGGSPTLGMYLRDKDVIQLVRWSIDEGLKVTFPQVLRAARAHAKQRAHEASKGVAPEFEKLLKQNEEPPEPVCPSCGQKCKD